VLSFPFSPVENDFRLVYCRSIDSDRSHTLPLLLCVCLSRTALSLNEIGKSHSGFLFKVANRGERELERETEREEREHLQSESGRQQHSRCVQCRPDNNTFSKTSSLYFFPPSLYGGQKEHVRDNVQTDKHYQKRKKKGPIPLWSRIAKREYFLFFFYLTNSSYSFLYKKK